MSGWLFGGWPPPPPSDGGTVTFVAVRDALGAATTNVPFNFEGLTQVASVNGLELGAEPTNHNSIAIGLTAADIANTTVNRLAIGHLALNAVTAATDDNVAIGNRSQRLVSTGSANVSVGHESLSSLTTGSSNTAVGNDAGLGLTTGQQNVAVGSQTLATGNGSENVAIGFSAGNKSTGADNVFIGWHAGLNALASINSVCIGSAAGTGITTGDSNVCIGVASGLSITTEDSSICINGDIPAAGSDFGMSIGDVLWGDLTPGAYKLRFGGAGTLAAQTERAAFINPGADTVPVMTWATTGTNPGKTGLHVGNRDPSAAVSAPAGYFYLRNNGATSTLYINRSAGTGTSWSAVTAVP